MRIGELSRKTGVTTSRIRFYEARRLIAPCGRAANGYRTYSERAVKLLTVIGQAQRLGFSLNEIERFLTPAAGHTPSPATLVPRLKVKLREIDVMLVELQQRRQDVHALLASLSDPKE